MITVVRIFCVVIIIRDEIAVFQRLSDSDTFCLENYDRRSVKITSPIQAAVIYLTI